MIILFIYLYIYLFVRMYNCTLLSAYTLPHQDNCNSLLAGCPQYLIDRLQVVQSATARLTCKTKQSLHWLPVRARIQDNICTLCLSVITGTGPQYLSEPLHLYTPSRDVRFSVDTCNLKICRSSIWSGIIVYMLVSQPEMTFHSLRHPDSQTFRQALKTHLFQQHF